MKKAFFSKVANSATPIRTGRYSYEYDQKKKAIHVTDTLGKVDKWVKEVDCEDYLFVKSPATTPTTTAPKAATTKATPATPAPSDPVLAALKAIGTALAEQGTRLAALEAKVSALEATPAPAPKVEATTPKATPAPKAKKEVKPLATHEGKLSKDGKATLKAIQAWAKKTRRPVEVTVNGSWIWVAGTEKNDREALKNMGFRWRASRQMWSWDDSRVKKSA